MMREPSRRRYLSGAVMLLGLVVLATVSTAAWAQSCAGGGCSGGGIAPDVMESPSSWHDGRQPFGGLLPADFFPRRLRPQNGDPTEQPTNNKGLAGQPLKSSPLNNPGTCEEDCCDEKNPSPNCPPESNPGQDYGPAVMVDPIVVASGTMVEDVVDLEIPAPGAPFRLVRRYNSSIARHQYVLGVTEAPSVNDLGRGWYTNMYNFCRKEDPDFYEYEFDYVDECGITHYTETPIEQMRVFYLYGQSLRFTKAPTEPEENIYYYALPPRKESIEMVYDEGTGKSKPVMHLADGTEWSYESVPEAHDPWYRLTKTEDRFSNTMTFYYECPMSLSKVVDTAGRAYTFQTTSNGYLTKVTDPAGRTLTYEYEGSRLTGFTDPEGRKTGYLYGYDEQYIGGVLEYAPTWQITGRTDHDGNEYYVNQYDGEGRVTKQTLAYGDYTFEYTGVGGLTVTTSSPYGEEQVWRYTDEDDAVGLISKTVKTDRSVRTGEGDYVTSYVYDSDTKYAQTHQSPSGLSEVYTVDGSKNMVSRRQVIGGQIRTYGYGYDAFGDNTYYKRTSYRTPGGGLHEYKRDSLARMTSRVRPTVNKGQASAQSIASTYAYDSKGQVTRVEDPLGVVTAYKYDSYGLCRTKIVDEGGLDLLTECLYDTVGNVTETVSPEGNKAWYYWDKTPLLTKSVRILDNSDTSKQYAVSLYYDNNKHVVSRTVEHKDQSGTAMSPALYAATYVPDVHGYITRTVYDLDATNRITADYMLDGTMRVTKVTNPNGTEEEYTYDERYLLYQKENCGGCGSQAITYDYNGNGKLTKQTDGEGNSTVYTLDGLNRVTRTSYYDNAGTPALLSYVEMAYDADGNMTQRTDRDASDTIVAKTSFYYDEVNRLYETRNWADPTGTQGNNDARSVSMYDAASRRTKSKVLLSGTDASPTWAETSYYYDNAGRMITRIDPEDGETTYDYDDGGNLLTSTDPEGNATIFAYDRLGRLTRATNAEGHYTVTQYDTMGNVITTVSYNSSAVALAKTGYDYDGLGRRITSRKLASPTGAASDTNDYRVIVYYDANGLVTKVTDAAGNDSTQYFDTYNRLQWRRDPLGNKLEYAYDSNNNVITTISYEIDQVNGNTKIFTAVQVYDGLNRATKSISPGADGDITATTDNAETTVYYDAMGRRTKVTDAESVSTAWFYHGLGRLTRSTEDVGGVNRTTDWGYDRARCITRITDDLGQSTDYAYDKKAYVTRTTYEDHDGGTDTVDQYYSAGGEMTKRIDQRGITTRYVYDDLGRLITKQDAWASPTIVEAYSYDGLSRRTSAVLTDSGTVIADVRYVFDGLSRLTRESQQIREGATRNVDYVFDKAGNRLTMTYPQAKNVAYTYDANNRISRILDGASARARYLYVGPARRSQVELLNGASTVSTLKLTYDGIAQVTSALYRNSGDTATIIGYEHGYDKVGNPEYEIRTHQSSEGDAYMYDNLYRVTRTIYDDADPTSPTYASARTDDWLLDDIGNRTKIYAKSASATEYLHNAVNEYTSVGGTGYEYDAAGNLTKDDTHYYYWDYENRLTKVELVSDSSDVAEYTYDAMMRRVEKVDKTVDPDVTTQFFYDGWEVIEERQSDGTLDATYITGAGLDDPILMNRDSTDYWYMQSPLNGSVAALVDSSGVIQEGYKHRAYGEPAIITGAGNDSTWFTSDDDTASISSIGNPYMYTARRYDEETGLMHFRLRMYDPETGSFISRDPIGYVDGMSLYLGYFAPAKMDPLGLSWSWKKRRKLAGKELDRVNLGLCILGKINNGTVDPWLISRVQAHVNGGGSIYTGFSRWVDKDGGTNTITGTITLNRNLFTDYENLMAILFHEFYHYSHYDPPPLQEVGRWLAQAERRVRLAFVLAKRDKIKITCCSEEKGLYVRYTNAYREAAADCQSELGLSFTDARRVGCRPGDREMKRERPSIANLISSMITEPPTVDPQYGPEGVGQ